MHDLIRWDSALRDPASGLSLLLTQLETGAPRDAGSNVEGDPSDAGGFAFGVYRRTFRDLPLLEYRGVSGYHYLVQVPGTELSVATLCNAYPGTYVGDDVDAFMYVRVEGGRVFVASHGFAETALEPMKQADRFDGHDIYETRFERDASGRVIALVLDAARVKGMRYTRR